MVFARFLTIVFAALAVSREAQTRTGLSIKKIITTLRPLRSAVITIGRQHITAEPRVPAEDVVQDAFIGLTKAAPRLRDMGGAAAYLRTSVVNGSRSALRRRRTVRGFLSRVTEPDPAPAADRHIVEAETHDEVSAALGTLPSRMREVLVLRYWSELSEREIAHTLGISEGTVKSTASRALDRLEIALGGTR